MVDHREVPGTEPRVVLITSVANLPTCCSNSRCFYNRVNQIGNINTVVESHSTQQLRNQA